ncbi:MAG TPA: hypothetical protein VFR35_13660 [Actinoplanes sp.]|nr:hypothetical protein [Actinoplanes sp.]
MTAAGPGAALAAPLGLRNLDQIYFVPLLVLLVLLVEREMIRSGGGPGSRTAVRILDVAILPLLAAFLVILGLRLNQVFSHT